MNSQHASIKTMATTIALSVALLIITAQASMAQVNPRLAINYSGIIAIAPGESASLNVTNLDSELTVARLVFVDAEGNELKSMMARVAGGRSAMLTLNYSELGDRTGRAHIAAVLVRPSQEAEKQLTSIVEVFDNNSGKTSFGLLLPAVRTAHDYFALLQEGVFKFDQ